MPLCKYGDPLCPCQDGDMCHYEGKHPMYPPLDGVADGHVWRWAGHCWTLVKDERKRFWDSEAFRALERLAGKCGFDPADWDDLGGYGVSELVQCIEADLDDAWQKALQAGNVRRLLRSPKEG